MPADNFARWLSTNRSFPDPPGIVTAVVVEVPHQSPLAKGGCLGTAEAGGFPRLAGFHIGLYFQEVPPVNPSVTATPCQLPLAREPFCARYRYFAEGLVSYLPPGGSYGVRTFPHWISEKSKCLLWNPSVKNQRFLPAPFHKGAFRCGGEKGARCRFCNGLVLFIPFSVPFPSPLPGSRAGQNHLPPAGAA